MVGVGGEVAGVAMPGMLERVLVGGEAGASLVTGRSPGSSCGGVACALGSAERTGPAAGVSAVTDTSARRWTGREGGVSTVAGAVVAGVSVAIGRSPKSSTVTDSPGVAVVPWESGSGPEPGAGSDSGSGSGPGGGREVEVSSEGGAPASSAPRCTLGGAGGGVCADGGASATDGTGRGTGAGRLCARVPVSGTEAVRDRTGRLRAATAGSRTTRWIGADCSAANGAELSADTGGVGGVSVGMVSPGWSSPRVGAICDAGSGSGNASGGEICDGVVSDGAGSDGAVSDDAGTPESAVPIVDSPGVRWTCGCAAVGEGAVGAGGGSAVGGLAVGAESSAYDVMVLVVIDGEGGGISIGPTDRASPVTSPDGASTATR
jgi:hypothetical protein